MFHVWDGQRKDVSMVQRGAYPGNFGAGDVIKCTLDLAAGRFTMLKNGAAFYETTAVECPNGGSVPLKSVAAWHPIVTLNNKGESATVDFHDST